MKEGWGFSWINVRYPDGRILNIQWLERGATAPGELPGELYDTIRQIRYSNLLISVFKLTLKNRKSMKNIQKLPIFYLSPIRYRYIEKNVI